MEMVPHRAAAPAFERLVEVLAHIAYAHAGEAEAGVAQEGAAEPPARAGAQEKTPAGAGVQRAAGVAEQPPPGDGAQPPARAGAESPARAGARVLKRPAASMAAPPKPPRPLGFDDGLFVVQLGLPMNPEIGIVGTFRAEDDGMALACLSGLWSQLNMLQVDKALYHRCYHKLRYDESPALFGLFNVVRVVERASPGTLWTRAGKGEHALVVGAQGSLRVGDGSVEVTLAPGDMVFARGNALSVVWPRADAARARAVVCFFEAISTQPDAHRAKLLITALAAAAKKHQTRALAWPSSGMRGAASSASTPPGRVPGQGDAISSPEQSPGSKRPKTASPALEAEFGGSGARRSPKAPGASWDEVAARGPGEPAVGLPSEETLRRIRVGAAVAAGVLARLPQHRGVLLHRIYLPGEKGVLPQWREYLKTWPAEFVQYIWTTEVRDFQTLAAGVANCVRMDASVLLPTQEAIRRYTGGQPVQLVKDDLQFRILHAFGGWYADLDLVWLRHGMWEAPAEWAAEHAGVLRSSPPQAGRVHMPGEPGCPAGPPAAALFFLQAERAGDAYTKSAEKIVTLGDRSCDINLGLVWGVAGARVFELVLEKFAELDAAAAAAWERDSHAGNPRYTREWLQHQLATVKVLRGRVDARMAPPHVAYPMPRALRKCPERPATMWGMRVSPVGSATAQSAAVCLWSSVWPDELAGEVLRLAQAAVAREAATPRRKAHGASCGEGRSGGPASSSSAGGAAAAGATEAEAAEAAVAAKMLDTVSNIEKHGMAALSLAGADLVLAHRCLGDAIGFASNSPRAVFSDARFGGPALAYGFLCLAARMHWPADTTANGLAREEYLWTAWAALFGLATAMRQPARHWCSTQGLSGQPRQ